MTLKERYAIRNKSGIWRFTSLYCVLTAFFLVVTSLARYEAHIEGYAEIEFARFNFEINGFEINTVETALKGAFTLTPIVAFNPDNKDSDGNAIKPYGYFEIKIDPAGTHVPFHYKLALDLSGDNKPDPRLKIGKYLILSTELPAAKLAANEVGNLSWVDFSDATKIEADVNLPVGSAAFTSNNAIYVYFFWSWSEESTATSAVHFNLELKQLMSTEQQQS